MFTSLSPKSVYYQRGGQTLLVWDYDRTKVPPFFKISNKCSEHKKVEQKEAKLAS